MSDKQLILSVDDEKQTQDLIAYALDQQYDMLFASDGDECLSLIEQQMPDLILLDVRMQGIDGYELCKKIRQHTETGTPPIIFVSALDSLKERLAGYEAGADDYVIKPFQSEELSTKVGLAIANKINKEQLQQSFNEAMQTAMTAMTSTGELGVVLNFLSESFRCDDFRTLAKAIIDSCANYQLNCCLQIRAGDEIVELDSKGQPTAIESNLLLKMASEKRFFDFGCRTAINFPKFTLLIKNMPLDNIDSYGRIKDNLGLLAEGANARIEAIEANNAVMLKQQALQTLMGSIKNVVEEINNKYHQHKCKSDSILTGLKESIEDAFIHLGLSDGQEQELMQIVQTTMTRSQDLYDQGLEVDQLFSQLIKRIEAVS